MIRGVSGARRFGFPPTTSVVGHCSDVMAPKTKNVDVSGHTSRLRNLQERKHIAVEELKALRSQKKEDLWLDSVGLQGTPKTSFRVA